MHKTKIIALVAGIAAGYFFAVNLAQYPVFGTAYAKGASMAA